MKIFQYSFSINPDIADSELVKNVQDELTKHSIDTYVKDTSTADKIERELPEDYNCEHVTKSFYITNGDIIRFIRIHNHAHNLFQVDIDRKWRFTPKYFRDMLDVLGATRDSGYSFNEMDVPDVKRNIFKRKK